MTREHYFEMCEQLGTKPIESEIPIEIEDFPEEIRSALLMWQCLPDNIDYFNGGYYGKHLHEYESIFKLYNVPEEDYVTYFNWVSLIDRLKLKQVKNKKDNAKSAIKASPQ